MYLCTCKYLLKIHQCINNEMHISLHLVRFFFQKRYQMLIKLRVRYILTNVAIHYDPMVWIRPKRVFIQSLNAFN